MRHDQKLRTLTSQIVARSLIAASLGGLIGATATGCKPQGQISDTKSFLGLQAGQDATVKSGNAPTFIALSDWFQKFSVAAAPAPAGGKRQKTMSQLKSKLPQRLVPMYVKYIDRELKRTADFKAVLASSGGKFGDDKLMELMETETKELKDIIMVILNERYKPKTGDALAGLIRVGRMDAFIDQFALDFLTSVLAKRQLAEVQASLEDERINYLKSLTNLYLSGESAKAKLADDLDKNEKGLRAMRAVLMGEMGGLELAGSNDEVRGAAAAFMQYGDALNDQRSASKLGLLEDVPPVDGLADTAGEKCDDAPAAPGKKPATPPQSRSAATPNDPNSTTFDPNAAAGQQTAPVAPAAPAAPQDDSSALVSALSQLLGGGAGLTEGEGATQKMEDVLPGAPVVDCTKMGLKGKSIIFCQRNFAYAQTKFTPRPVAPSVRTGLGLDDGVKGDTCIIRQAATPVKNQGSVPSCTAQALSGQMETVASLKSKERGAGLNLTSGGSVTLDADTLWNAQGQETYLEASLRAATNAFESQGVTLESENPISNEDEMIAAIEKEDEAPPYMGIPLGSEWTSGGVGGDEFGLAGSGVDGNIVGCAEGGPGHAIFVVGHIEHNGKRLFVIKNSWGSSWGDDGYGYLDFSTCSQGGGMVSVYAPKVNAK